MFKEIENELMSIISDDPIEKIAHMPSKEIAKTMDLIYNIKFEEIERVYTEPMGKLTRMVIIYKSEADDKNIIGHDLCPINGKIYHITLFPSYLLNKDEGNAITLSRAVIKYVSIRISLLMDQYENIISNVKDNILDLVILQSIPVITCAVMRQIYSGPSLSKVIYMSLSDMIPVYKKVYSEEGVNSILNLFDEGLGVSELIDSGFICSIAYNDLNYPGIWSKPEENKDE